MDNNKRTWNSVPPEIIYQILTYQFNDFMRNDHPGSAEKFNENLATFLKSNLTVNKMFYHICRVLVYRYCNLTTAKRFHSLLTSLKSNASLRNVVQVLDFQELTSIGLGRTGEMNKMIKNLTNETILEFLHLTRPTLREFLANENIQDDLDSNIIKYLFSNSKVLSVIDFCGCSGSMFTRSFIDAIQSLQVSERNSAGYFNYQITCLGLNDCTDLPSFVLKATLQMLPELQKLDLAHTTIDDDTLMNGVPHLKNLTHLSLAMCVQLTPRAILEFFSHHPAVTDENNSATLEWLNLSVQSHSSSWTEVHTMFLLKKLCRYGHNKTLQYLNIGGLPLHLEDVDTMNTSLNLILSPNENQRSQIRFTRTGYYISTKDTLLFIKLNFPKLKSLSIRGNSIPISKLVEFLTPDKKTMSEIHKSVSTVNNSSIFSSYLATPPEEEENYQKLRFLNISDNPHINKWTIHEHKIYTSCPTLVALEVSFDAWQQIEKSNRRHEIIAMKPMYDIGEPTTSIIDMAKMEPVRWKCYIDSSYGRRYWLFKTDPYLNKGNLESMTNFTEYDLQGNKIIKIINQPDFLKFAQCKIMLGCGLVPQSAVRRQRCYRDVKPPISQFFTRNGGITFGNRAAPIVTPRLPPGGWRRIYSNLEDENLIGTSESDDPFSPSNTIIEEDESRETPEYYNQSIQNRPVSSSIESGQGMDHYIQRRTSSSSSMNEIREGLYWDRSIQDLQALENNTTAGYPHERLLGSSNDISSLAEDHLENDEEYLNNPELQRRRSQLSLFLRASTSKNRRPGLSILGNNGASRSSSSKSLVTTMHKPKNYYYEHPEEFIYDPNDQITSERYVTHFHLVSEYTVFGCLERGMYRYYSLKA
ncbi:Uncharacterized protein RNJ44_00767 [Nakaseomyces bracarensis]|uniref:Uncharacterized protein n=1 Tax=Nakaseomyces bracarensis TaxID=273131 RepID=A0ABR4NS29_9SACH